jgi:putative membrane protein
MEGAMRTPREAEGSSVNTDDNDFRDFLPGTGRPPLSVVPAPEPGPRLHEPDEPRQGDTALGRPVPVALEQRPLTTEERAELATKERQEAERIADQLMYAGDPPGFEWFGRFASPLALALAFGTFGVFGVFVFNQTAQLIGALAEMPLWAQCVGYAGLGLFALCILFALGRFALLYLRLRENRQLRLKGVRELDKRVEMRAVAEAKAAEARDRIVTYLNEYPLKDVETCKKLARLGLTHEVQQHLMDARKALLDRDQFVSTEQWLARFRAEFQTAIDAAAEERIKYWSNRVFVVTALSPNAVIDSGAALFYTFSMLSDLCELYNLRAGRAGTTVLLGRAVFNAYIAGQGPEWEKLAEEQYGELFNHAVQSLGIGVSSAVVGKVLGKVGAKATTGYMNRVLLARLGRYGAHLLRPVGKDS